jgi:transcriptional regulator with XRE-family HTH domain
VSGYLQQWLSPPISQGGNTFMARARLGLAKAVNEILESKGVNGKRLSFRQSERLTGLAPATVSELAKGNARTPETVRRFAQGMEADVTRLLLLAGFVPEEEIDKPASVSSAPLPAPRTRSSAFEAAEVDPEEREWLGRMGRALAMLPPGRERELWKENLRRDTELIEAFVERLAAERPSHA